MYFYNITIFYVNIILQFTGHKHNKLSKTERYSHQNITITLEFAECVLMKTNNKGTLKCQISDIKFSFAKNVQRVTALTYKLSTNPLTQGLLHY